MPTSSRAQNVAGKSLRPSACNASLKYQCGPVPIQRGPASPRSSEIVQMASNYLRARRRAARVRAAFRAACERLDVLRRRAAVRAWRDNARCDAAERPSLFKALVVARERLAEVRLRVDLWRRLSFCADAVPLRGGANLTPAFLAFDKPIAIACFGLLTPCLPSRTWWISSRTNSPAWVLGAFPSSASLRARIIVSRSGILPPYELSPCGQFRRKVRKQPSVKSSKYAKCT